MHHHLSVRQCSMPQLPSMRVKPAKPFEFVGIDFLGPSTTNYAGQNVKTWIVIICCMVTRNLPGTNSRYVINLRRQCFTSIHQSPRQTTTNIERQRADLYSSAQSFGSTHWTAAGKAHWTAAGKNDSLDSSKEQFNAPSAKEFPTTTT